MNKHVVADTQSNQFETVQFHGKTREYFGIWIVNILLTILTLGIYSAWAKVRRKRYFLGNTEILGRTFDYHATGKQILIGRLIVFALLVVYNLTVEFFPVFGIFFALFLMVVFPWFIMRSLRFNARVTSYRNIRFDFVGKLPGSYLAFLLGPLLAFASLGLLAPLSSRWATRYIGNNMRYGGRSFQTNPALKDFYVNWLVPALMIVAGGLLGALMLLAAISFKDQLALEEILGSSQLSVTAIVMMSIMMSIAYIFATIIYRAGVRNIAYSATKFDNAHDLKSDLPRFGYLWLLIVNFLATILTLSLLRPWAAVRQSAYLAKYTHIRTDGQIEQLVASIEESGTAVAAEYTDFEGFDFGF